MKSFSLKNKAFISTISLIFLFQIADSCRIYNPCKNGGMCYMDDTETKCFCVNGWTGDRCRTPPADVEVKKTDMRPELLQLIQEIVTSKIVAFPDIKESASEIRNELNTQWPCCWDVIVVDSSVELGYAIWYVPDNHLDINIRTLAGHSRRVLVSKDNYDYMTIFYDPNKSDNAQTIQSHVFGK